MKRQIEICQKESLTSQTWVKKIWKEIQGTVDVPQPKPIDWGDCWVKRKTHDGSGCVRKFRGT